MPSYDILAPTSEANPLIRFVVSYLSRQPSGPRRGRESGRNTGANEARSRGQIGDTAFTIRDLFLKLQYSV